MDLLTAVYQLLIGPLELFFEYIFGFAFRVTDNVGVSIIFLSLAMNFLVLPLYRRADAMQMAEAERAKKMKHWVEHIKKTFTGDERFMMLQTYYRQNDYKQTDALRGSISLLLEIPFFIAAYHFLSNLEILHGVNFGPLYDLGAPDALLQFDDVSINLLPLIMTALNLISAVVYLKGFPLRSKIQTYGIAAIFLILLYNSPSGLVFYWTLNNLFSLLKNVFMKLKKPGFVLSIISSVSGIALLIFLLVNGNAAHNGRVEAITFCVLLQLPLIVYFVKKRLEGKIHVDLLSEIKVSTVSFTLSCVFLALLTGVLIPSAVISASPAEFIVSGTDNNPVVYVINSLCLAVGVFIIWIGAFYRLATDNGKKIFMLLMWIGVGCATVNYMFFGTGYGTISTLLQFDREPIPEVIDMIVNYAVLILVAGVFFIFWRWRKGSVRMVPIAACIAIVCMSALNISTILQGVDAAKSGESSAASESSDNTPHIKLSKTGQNVVVLMMDRAAGFYFPMLINEKPELQEALSGFTYYPNALSYASSTNHGVPGLYGGYDYIPDAMDERSDMLLQDKHDEALRVLPVLFDEAGYDVTVCDPTFAGYKWDPDLSIYDDHPNISSYVLDGYFTVKGFEKYTTRSQAVQSYPRNFFCYSLVKIAPLSFQASLYRGGTYNAGNGYTLNQTRSGMSRSTGINGTFMDAYSTLCALPEMTEFTDNEQGSFVMMSNDTTHSPTLLSEPDYTPSASIDNTEYDKEHSQRLSADGTDARVKGEMEMMHYQVNMASLLKLGEWFDYLREEGVYDNTRIIIVSDHAWGLLQDPDLMIRASATQNDDQKNFPVDLSSFNCMLLVKDFNATGITTDSSFMTNADTPALATNGLFSNAKNPFTGNLLANPLAKEGEQHVTYVKYFNPNDNNGYTFREADHFSVHDDVRDGKNWEYLGWY